MKSITIHGMEESLNKRLREEAAQRKTSLNKTIKQVLEGALGIKSEKERNNREDFLDLHGVWSEKDEAEFLNKIKDFEKINPKDWK